MFLFTFLGTSAAECYVSECTRGYNNWTGTSQNRRLVEMRQTFLKKSSISSRRDAIHQNRGGYRGPTLGPRNLNENPAPEELSGKSEWQ